MNSSAPPAPVASGITAVLLQLSAAPCYADLPEGIATLAKQCLLDWFGVATLGARDGMVDILIAEARDRGAAGNCRVAGRDETLNPVDAALANGTAAHALDYDDGNPAGGHLSAPVAAAVLTLAQHTGADGRGIISAFIAGYEFAARVGYLVRPGHYARGFHPTATLGTLGAARGRAALLGLDDLATGNAIGIAATQAAGLVASFGTMCKPLHVGRAAANGLLAARLAALGYTGNTSVLEHPQGFAAPHSVNFNAEAATATPGGGFFLADNTFKFHASCAGTHAAIEGLRRLLAEHTVAAGDVTAMTLAIGPHMDKVCNIQAPETGLQIKFSLRMMGALALAGWNTADPAIFSASTAADPALVALRDKTRVVLDPTLAGIDARVELQLGDGRRLVATCPAATPEKSLGAQGARLAAKFLPLATGVAGDTAAQALLARIQNFEQERDLAGLFALTAPVS